MDAISAGRTGRAFFADLTGTGPFELRFAREAGASFDDLVAQVESNARAWLESASDAPGSTVMDALGEFVNSIAHGIQSEWRDFDDVLTSAFDVLELVDAELGSRQNLSWWNSTIDRSQQQGFVGSSVTPGTVIARSEEALRAGSVWWVAPTGAMTSSRKEAPGVGPVAERLIDDYWLTGPDDRLVSVSVDEDAQVFEVADAEDWSQLVREHPRPSPELVTYSWGTDASAIVLPNWASVASTWDGVHVSVAGYLNAAYRPILLPDGSSTILAGWHPDATVWLTDAAQPH